MSRAAERRKREKEMIIYPAIDLIGGEAVRLLRGDYENKTVYSADPAGVAAKFAGAGAERIHVVDLDGAKSGGTPNFDTVCRIKEKTGLFVEVGGGIRSLEVIRRYAEAGIDRVILGTSAIADEELLKKALDRYGERIAVGADLRDGHVAVKGWLEVSDVTAEDFFARMQSLGVKTVICTDISKDGAMGGTNLALYRELSRKYAVNITASGGVSTAEDVRALAKMGLYGAIIGKAYYTGALRLEDALAAAAAGEAEADR